MKFNNGDDLSIVDEINDIAHSDNNSYPLESKARRCNYALDRFFTIAFKADGRWTFDDINQTTVPLQSITLTTNIDKYALDTFTSEIIKVLRVEILTATSLNAELTRLDETTIQGALTDYKSTAGTPEEYRLFGKYIYMYPKPNYTLANALSLYFNRNKSAFTAADTTKEPGIPSIFHMYIARLAGYLELEDKGELPRGGALLAVKGDEDDIADYFTHREKPKRGKPINHR